MSREHVYISTSFWDDAWICSLKSSEKLLYLYLLSNSLTNIAGVYKIIDSRISFDSGLSMKEVVSAMKKFEKDGKAYRMGEYIVIPSYPKHQKWETSPKIKEGIIGCLVNIGVDNLLKLEEYNYRFDLKIVFDKLSLPYPYPKPKVPTTQLELFSPSIQQTILDQAAKAGFYIDQEDAKNLLEKTDPAWFGDNSFVSFVAMKIREHEKYSVKPPEEQRRIFRKVLLEADNYRQEYPSWREKKEKKDREEAHKVKRKEMLAELKRCPPIKCECGTNLDEDLRCLKCGKFYWLDEKNLKWMSCEGSMESFSEGFRKRIRKTT
jgi:hypothetical protein